MLLVVVLISNDLSWQSFYLTWGPMLLMFLGAETIIMRTNCENDLFFIVALWPATASNIKGEDNETYHMVYYGKMTIWGFFDRRTDTFCYVVAWGFADNKSLFCIQTIIRSLYARRLWWTRDWTPGSSGRSICAVVGRTSSCRLVLYSKNILS